MTRNIVKSRESKSGVADHIQRSYAEVVIEEVTSGDYQIT
jgi:ERCC4-type nuclease